MKYIANPVEVTAYQITDLGPTFADGSFIVMVGTLAYAVSAEMAARYTPAPGDYYVIQSDGYAYLNPKDVFERKYRPRDNDPSPENDPDTSKPLDISDVNGAKANISDLVVFGNGDSFRLLCKASSKTQGWMKSAKAYEIGNVGCIVQVTTQQGDNVAEALVYVPGVKIVDDVDGGRKLVAWME